MDYALGLFQPAGAQFMLSGAGPKLDNQDLCWSFKNKFYMIVKTVQVSGLGYFFF